MIDTSKFETSVFIDKQDDDGKVQHVTFKNQQDKIVFVYKYRTRKSKKIKEVTQHE